jgi:parallel beta-helix repeat protein
MKGLGALSIALLASLPLLATDARAGSPACGDTIVGLVTLIDDLACPSGPGLVLADGATLDCAGFRITGGGQAEQYGIYVRDAGSVVVQNCVVEGFEVGIRLTGATNAVIQDNVSRDNTRYGMELTQSTVGAMVQRNTIQDNGDEGMHVSGPTDAEANHQIAGNTVDGNANEGIYLFQTSGNLLTDNIIQNHHAAGIYVKQSSRNRLVGNVLTNDPLQLVDGSDRNVIVDTTIVGQAIKFDHSSNNRVRNLTIQSQDGRPGVAFSFTASSGNRIVNAGVTDSDYEIQAVSGSQSNIFAWFAVPSPLSCAVDGSSSVTVKDRTGHAATCGN